MESGPGNEKKPSRLPIAALLLLNLLLLAAVAIIAMQRSRENRLPQLNSPEFRQVVARVNGQPIFRRELLSAAQFDGKTRSQMQLRRALDRLIRSTVAAQAARRVPAETISPELIAKMLETVHFQFAETAKSAAALDAAGLTEDGLRARFLAHQQVETWLRRLARCEPAEAECRAWLAAHPEISTLPEVAEASHFAAIFPPRGQPADLLARGDLIREAQARLQEGIPFPQLIDAFSDDPAKKVTHGSLFWFRKERMDPALAEAAFRQPLDQVGAPVETRFGFHLLRVSDRHSAAQLSYEQVAAEVRQRCRDEQERKKMEQIVTDLVQRAKIKILDPQLL